MNTLFVPTNQIIDFLTEHGWAARPGTPSIFAHSYQPDIMIKLDVNAEAVSLDFVVEDWTRDGAKELAQMLGCHFLLG